MLNGEEETEREFVSVEGNYLKRFFYYIFSFLISLFFLERERWLYINNETFHKCTGARSIVKTLGMSQSIVCMRKPTSSTVIQTVSKRNVFRADIS